VAVRTIVTAERPGGRGRVVVASPVGPLALEAAGGALAGVRMDGGGRPGEPAGLPGTGDLPQAGGVLAEAARQLRAYFAGELTEFDLPLLLEGTAFQRAVWERLRQIPYGETTSYGELARRIGRPGASRAVGLANRANPVAIVVPCHRVIGADGSLTGYGGGLDRKRFLLALERRVSGRALA